MCVKYTSKITMQIYDIESHNKIYLQFIININRLFNLQNYQFQKEKNHLVEKHFITRLGSSLE